MDVDWITDPTHSPMKKTIHLICFSWKNSTHCALGQWISISFHSSLVRK